MTHPLRITMLGYTGSGKTCFLYGMYGLLRTGFNGYTIRPSDLDMVGDYNQVWERLLEPGQNRWPQNPGSNFDEHKFRLLHGNKPVVNLDWIDYRGGTLKELFSHKEKQTLLSYLLKSDCIFLSVPGEYLRSGLTVDDAQRFIRPQDMNDLMGEVIDGSIAGRSMPLPIAIIITKADLCISTGLGRFRSTRRVIDDIKRLFHTLFAPSVATGRFMTAICPVTLGRELARDPVNGRINPRHFDLPLLFAAWTTLSKELNIARAMKEDSVRIRDLKNQVDSLRDEVRGVPIYIGSKRAHL